MINLLFGFGSGSIGLSLSASAAFITSALLSSLSAPCGVVLSLSSIRILQRCECACALLLSPRAVTTQEAVDGYRENAMRIESVEQID